MGFIEGVNRNQIVLFPESLDEYIEENNIVRFIDIFIESLDLKELGFQRAVANEKGRNSYNPSCLLKLYIYGYLNKIISSRLLERETHRNVELMWLVRKLKPDFKTISDFRRNNNKSIKKVFRQFSHICNGLDLFGKELVAIDGSKFEAVNSRGKAYTKKQVEEKLEKISNAIENYLEEIERTDKEEENTSGIVVKELKEKIKKLEDCKEEYKEIEKLIESSKDDHICLTDQDSKIMKTRRGKNICYNPQIAVDDKNNLIVDYEMTNECSDKNQLSSMFENVKEVLDVEEIDLLADSGFFNRYEIEKAQENGANLYVSQSQTHNGSVKDPRFHKDNFTYDKEKDVYICPRGFELEFVKKKKDSKGKLDMRLYQCKSCENCPDADKCKTTKGGRNVLRWEKEEIIEEMILKMKKESDKVKKRKSIVEAPFGIMKHAFKMRQFLTKGLDNVEAEFGFMALAFNIKRVTNIVGVQAMIQAIA